MCLQPPHPHLFLSPVFSSAGFYYLHSLTHSTATDFSVGIDPFIRKETKMNEMYLRKPRDFFQVSFHFQYSHSNF